MEKIILHCDLNNFYASVECIDHPELKNYPMAVCGSVEDRHGIVLAKNELAKSKGVKTAEPVWQAKQKCPELVIVSPNMDKYIKKSKQVKDIYCKYTDLVEPFGIDECWLDVSGSTLLFGTGEQIANKIKEEVKEGAKLTISVGVSFTKIFAKLGSDMEKPDAVTLISKENFKQKVWPLKAYDLLGVGKSTYKKLSKYGITTIGDIANSDIEFIKNILGKNGEALWYYSNGLDNLSVAHQDENTIPKSIGNSTTSKRDLTSIDEVWKVMYFLSESVSTRLRQEKLLATAIQIYVKDNTLSSKEYQAPLPFPTRYPKDLSDIGISLFKKNYKWDKNVRAIGIRAINLVPDSESVQMSFLYDQDKINSHDALEEKVFILRNRYGENAITRASLLENKNTSSIKKYDEIFLPSNFLN